MAFTDSEGNVFETNSFGRPQGFWKNNKYVFPKFGSQPAAAQPVIVEPQPAAQPQQNNFRLPSTTANMRQENQQNSEGLGEGDFSTDPVNFDLSTTNLNFDPGSLRNNQTLGTIVGSGIGRLGGPVGSMIGGAVGGGLAGRGIRGSLGGLAGSLIGTAMLGPLGGLLSVAGGRMGDLHDMEDGLAFEKNKQSGLLDTLGYGFGFGDDMPDRMRDYYGVDQYAPAMVPDIGNFHKGRQVYKLSNFADAPKTIDPLAIQPLQPMMADSDPVGDPFTSLADMFSDSQGQDDSGYGDDTSYSGYDDSMDSSAATADG